MAKFNLTILTPQGIVYDKDAESIVAPGESGYFGILANHAPMIAATTSGVLKVTSGGEKFFAMGPGIVEVSRNNVNILADNAEDAKDEEEAKRKAKNVNKAS